MGISKTVASILGVAFCLATAASQADTLDRIKTSGEIKIGYRSSSMPLSWSADGTPTGFMVALCEKIVTEQISTALHKPIKITYVPVTVQTRFQLLDQQAIDMECGSTTVTLERMKQVDFSLATYITTSRLVSLKKTGALNLSTMNGRVLAVQTGSSHAELISKMLGGARLLQVPDAARGVEAVANGKAAAYVDAENLILSAIKANHLQPADFTMGTSLSVEPFAIVTRKGDTGLEKLIDQGLRKAFSHSEATVTLLQGYSTQMGADINALTRDAIRNPSRSHECSMLEAVTC
ncbi:transporter substrate-binding domain-containing protein [Amantichitinum ursilacus]|uniref:Glutamate/aspartate periplasmic-binding protein n=1 Tax=Amantichitinum ursilacus TaxID=857265 RepID=A0A0N0XMR9_9NEIS|nr:transporter substrate-binding domain-containing protein [Amantichitinum ursilacus]KPC55037.1 Glutamate/aspartate periplasmic-binding protein precursor [Amantichitinum ursilacus]